MAQHTLTSGEEVMKATVPLSEDQGATGNNDAGGTLLAGDEVSVSIAKSTEDDKGGGIASDGKASASLLQSSKSDVTAILKLESIVSSISSLNLGTTMASFMSDPTTNPLTVEASTGHDVGHTELDLQDTNPSDSVASLVETSGVDTVGINPENPDNQFHSFSKLPIE